MIKDKSARRIPRATEKEKTVESNLFEGIVSIRAILSDGCKNRKIIKILYAEERTKSNPKELGWLRAKAAEHGFSVDIVPREKIDSIALGTTHGGIVAYCSERDYPMLDENFIEKTRNKCFYVMIEGIEDPFNFGYALRSIYSAGADGIILSRRNWMSAAGVVCRSSAGASELTPIALAESTDAARLFKKFGFKIVCADIDNSVSVYDADLSYPVLLIVGGEKRGISRSLLSEADTVVRLDYGRDFPEALSAASAASILSYEILRQNKIK